MLISVTLTEYERRYIIDLIEVRRRRLKNIMDNLFQSYIRYVILTYSRPSIISGCYRALRELDMILGQVEFEVADNDIGEHTIKLLLKAKKIAEGIGGETQAIIEDLIEDLYLFYDGMMDKKIC